MCSLISNYKGILKMNIWDVTKQQIFNTLPMLLSFSVISFLFHSCICGTSLGIVGAQEREQSGSNSSLVTM